MSLEELNEQVYKKDSEPVRPKIEPEMVVPLAVHQEPSPSPSRWADKLPIPTLKDAFKEQLQKKRKLILGTVAVVAVLIMALSIVGRFVFAFDPDAITIRITGPKFTKAGETTKFVVEYDNPNWSSLPESEITIAYPESFELGNLKDWQVTRTRATHTLPALKGRGVGQVEFEGSFQSFDQTNALLVATLRFSPKGLANTVEKRADWSIELERSLIDVSVNGPPRVANGQAVEYVVEYRNESDETLRNATLVMEYPEGFTPTSFEPRPTRDDRIWNIDTLAVNEQGSINIKGTMLGRTGDSRRLVARIRQGSGDGAGPILAQEEKITQVIAPPLNMALSTNATDSIVQAGQIVNFRLSFTNEGDFGLRDLIAKVTIDPTHFNVSQLSVARGTVYDPNTKQVIFKAADIASLGLLEPGRGGEITFSVPVRKDLAASNQREVQIIVAATMDSPDMPHSINTEALVAMAETRLKVRSEVTLAVDGYFYDNSFPNTGPMPPQVNQETTYTLYISARSSLNALTGAQLSMSFPGSVRYLGVVSGDSSNVSFNERTGDWTWKPGTVPAGLGNGKSLVLRIGLTPPLNSVGQTLDLVNGGEFVAKDSFTGTDSKISVKKKDMSLPEDPRLLAIHKQVAPSE